MREEIDGHTTIGGGAVIRISKDAMAGLAKSFNRIDQAGPEIKRLSELLQEFIAEVKQEPENTAHLGMTPDGGYKAPEGEESFPIRSLPVLEDNGSGRYGSNGG